MATIEGAWPRTVIHADMDAFYASVEQRDRPELRGKPLLVGGTGRRGVVSTASYEARPFGCHSAMPMEEARRLCPQAVVLPPDFARYQEASGRIMEVFARFSPLVEPLSLDEAFLEATGTEGLFGPPEALGLALKRQVFEATRGLTVSVGIATSKFVAKVASDHRKPDGLTIVEPGAETDFLWPLDVSRLWGVGPKTRARLERLGLRTVGDLARRSEGWLEERLGSLGPFLRELAWGRDDRPVVPEHDPKSVGAEETLERDVVGAAAIAPHLKRSAERVARHLRRENLLAGGLRVKLKTSGFRLVTRQAALDPPSDSERDLLAAAEGLLGAFDLTVPMRLVGLAAFDLEPAGVARQGDLFVEAERERLRSLERTVDDIRERFGGSSVSWGPGKDGPAKKVRQERREEE